MTRIRDCREIKRPGVRVWVWFLLNLAIGITASPRTWLPFPSSPVAITFLVLRFRRQSHLKMKTNFKFESVPQAFRRCLVALSKEEAQSSQLPRQFFVKQDDATARKNIAKFSKERDLLLAPYALSRVSIVQWPPFLLASKIPIAVNMAKDFTRKEVLFELPTVLENMQS
ncbi:hypothetical protein Ancab_013088 [Ancistrocladus abbreviatus]